MAYGDIDALNHSAEWREQKQGLLFQAYAKAPTITNRIVPSEGQNVVIVGGRAARMVFEKRRSLAASVVDLNGGALNEPGGISSSEFYVGTYPLVAAAGTTLAQEMLNSNEQVTVGASDFNARTLGHLGEQFAQIENVCLHLDDTGIIAGGTVGCSAANAGAGTMTFAHASDKVRNYRCLVGMTVEVFDVTLATRRVPPDTTKPTIITASNASTGVVTFANLPAATVATDIIVLPGLIAPVPASGFHAGFATGTLGTTPAALATPASATVSGASAMAWGGQPWRKGLPYFVDSDSTHYFFNLLRSANPYMTPTGVDAGAAALTFTHLTTLRDALIQKKNMAFNPGDLVGLTHHTQLTKLQSTQVVSPISGAVRYYASDTSVGATKDPVPTGPKSFDEAFMVMGVPVYQSPMWRPNHMAFFHKPTENLGRTWAPDGRPSPLSLGGRDTFEVRDAYGKIRTATLKFMKSVGDLWAKDLSGFGEIYNLS